MGHLFRGLNFAKHLAEREIDFMFAVNDDPRSCEILEEKKIGYEIVVLTDTSSNWEADLIEKFQITTWIDDRLDTDFAHSSNVKKKNVSLVTFDNIGTGAAIADLNVVALPCLWKRRDIYGNKILIGTNYLIIAPEVERYRRIRTEKNKIVVTLGGSDTYGVTVAVAEELVRMDIAATILLGPNFEHHEELLAITEGKLKIKRFVPSLVKEFYGYDLAITGGGITPFEANAAGLPCIIIANEQHEILNAEFLNDKGCSVYAGFRRSFKRSFLHQNYDIKKMSQNGLNKLRTDGARTIVDIVTSL